MGSYDTSRIGPPDLAFLPKIVAHSVADPFGLTLVSMQDMQKIESSYARKRAAEGVDLSQEFFETIDALDRKAFLDREMKWLFDLTLPYRRFGVEVCTDDTQIALIYDVHHTTPHGADMSLAAADHINVHMLCYDLAGNKGRVVGKIPLLSFMFHIRPKQDAQHLFQLHDLRPAYTTRRWWRRAASHAFDPLGANHIDSCIKIINSSLVTLRALQEESILVQKTARDMRDVNKQRSGIGRPALSPVIDVLVDESEARRLENSLADEIRTAMETKDGYAVQGLVLVFKSYQYHISGKEVGPHARCENRAIRDEATAILRGAENLQDIDWGALAHLVRRHGNETTQARFDGRVSTAQRVQVVRPAGTKRPATVAGADVN